MLHSLLLQVTLIWILYDGKLTLVMGYFHPTSNITATKGQDITFKCDVATSDEITKQSWTYESSLQSNILFINTQKWEADGSRFSLVSRSKGYFLHLTDVKPEDEGIYTCTLYDGKENALKSTTHLSVNVPATITKFTENVVVNEGTEVVLQCQAEGKPQPKIKWRHLLPSADRVRATTEFLPLGRVSRGSAGRYECVADNGVMMPVRQFIHLTVNYAPELDVEESSKSRMKVPRGSSVTMECSSFGVPVPTIDWIHPNRGRLRNSGNGASYNIVRAPMDNGILSKLILPAAKLTDFGKYICIVTNALGSANHSVTLLQKFLPPTRLPPEMVFGPSVKIVDVEDSGRGCGCRLHTVIISTFVTTSVFAVIVVACTK